MKLAGRMNHVSRMGTILQLISITQILLNMQKAVWLGYRDLLLKMHSKMTVSVIGFPVDYFRKIEPTDKLPHLTDAL